jgi:DNA mismatch repair protein MutS
MSQATPMMQQYFSQKEKYSDTLLFFRMGDFFELFYDDAVKASKALDIALTKRGKSDDANAVPMCGVPAHSYEPYLQKLIRSGFKVAICDQLESPEEAKKRGYKEIVRREVVRVVTPGTLTEETLLDSKKSNYLLSFARVAQQFGLAWVDISTGEFNTSLISANQLASELARLKPSEILLPDALIYEENLFETYADWKNKLTPQSTNIFELKRAESKLKSFYKVISLEGFGSLSKPEISACGALLEYLELTQKMSLPVLQFPKQVKAESFMQIDASTRKSLELTEGEITLFETINQTQTSAGARLLYSMLSSPLIYAEGINARLDAVQFFFNNAELRDKLRSRFAQMPDMERATSRIAIGRGTPRDMLMLRTALTISYEIKNLLLAQDSPALVAEATHDIKNFSDLLNNLIEAFKDDVGVYLEDGNFIRESYSAELDELLNIRDHSRQLVNNLKEQYAEETGIPNLKINYNNMMGYFVEVTAQNAKKLSEKFIHRQTMANAMRFCTAELSELESKIITARDAALQIELGIFGKFVEEIREQALALATTAKALAFLDVMSSLALLAQERNYTKPVIDDSQAFEIKAARHPVVERGVNFVANDCNLNHDESLWLLTGPNMAGKSTFLRQNALIAILAQIGSFVPAASAHIGCVDRVFSRVGASDNLARGQSTFMVEMLETAAIVNLASAKSLVILDEIGRGTATYDGLSIAWSVLEHIHNKIKCRTIFATHYHELTKLKLARLGLYSMKVREWKEEIIFMHEVQHGAADRSYGIHVAKLAGLPKQVTDRAEEILSNLESKNANNTGLSESALPLFNYQKAAEPDPKTSAIIEELAKIDPNSLTPKEALDLIFKLKS